MKEEPHNERAKTQTPSQDSLVTKEETRSVNERIERVEKSIARVEEKIERMEQMVRQWDSTLKDIKEMLLTNLSKGRVEPEMQAGKVPATGKQKEEKGKEMEAQKEERLKKKNLEEPKIIVEKDNECHREDKRSNCKEDRSKVEENREKKKSFCFWKTLKGKWQRKGTDVTEEKRKKEEKKLHKSKMAAAFLQTQAADLVDIHIVSGDPVQVIQYLERSNRTAGPLTERLDTDSLSVIEHVNPLTCGSVEG
ncbi:stress response protein nst1-like [Megalops cyprinoides]|uniref:stress response protein nst1-like n=1 Tax=Megalops cyprinoides TaxID=118141 RepID=UPI001864C420|nr:stress response protein nst1-like [Megalops cyprinoides]